MSSNLTPMKIAEKIIRDQAEALLSLSNALPSDFEKVVEYISNSKHRIILSGMGKPGYIARKLAASFASTGTAAFYIHPAEASHGDLGMITEQDLVIILSASGETRELFDIIRYCKRFGIKIAAITMASGSTLAQSSDFLLLIPSWNEASSITAPTTSTLMMLSLGDAITVAVQEKKGFSKEDFAIYHPGGKIGADLKSISELMYTGELLPLIKPQDNLETVIDMISNKRFGCAIVIDANDVLIGIITDGDLRRNITKVSRIQTASEMMTFNPTAVKKTQFAAQALHIMNSKSITALPVVNDINQVIGIVHIHDILRAGIG